MSKKIAIITGASRGIGFEAAKKFVDNHWQVINLSRTPCSLPEVKNYRLDCSQLDWFDKESTALQALVSSTSQIALIHNAGICFDNPIQKVTAEELKTTFSINVFAPVLLNQVYLPFMSPGSSILYVGSTLSEIAVKNTASYTASKHAIAGFMKATCQDLDNSGIHTCCICPGMTNTEMLQARAHHDQNLLHQFAQLQSFKRLIDPKEIAAMIYFAAENPVLNGAVIHCNLGQITG